MDATSMRGVLGFGNPAHAPGAHIAHDGTELYATTASNKQDVFFSTERDLSLRVPAFAGPVPVELTEYTEALNASTTLAQRFTAAESGRPSGIILKGEASLASVVRATITRDADRAVLAEVDVNAVPDAASWIAEFPNNAEILAAGTVYVVEFSTHADLVLYRAEVFNDDASNALYRNETIASTSDALSFDLTVENSGHAVESPGQCDLTGERYVLVRSPDIEQHLHRNLASAFDRMAPGMGLCKLGGFGFREERFNFLAYSTRPFHPVGKLREVRIRLEKRDGTLYNAHGIDHVLMFVAKMYVPAVSDAVMASGSSSNPAYTPDLRRSIISKLERERT
jgi:hypothetical protein